VTSTGSSCAIELHCVAQLSLLAERNHVVCDSRSIVELNVERRRQDGASAQWSKTSLATSSNGT
jgi:hypothetical protein